MNIKQIPILYMGTPQMSADLLEYLIEQEYNIIGVVAQPDQKVGRKQELVAVPTKQIAMKHGIPVFQPIKIRKDFSFLEALNFELILCFAYGQIIPEEVLKMPRYGALNYHGSILPKYRGAAPIQYAIMNNDSESGVCLMEMVKKMDAGRVFALEKFPINNHDNYEDVATKMVETCKLISDKYLQRYVEGELVGTEQDESKVTFSPSIKSEEERINLTDSTDRILGLIRALSPHVGAYIVFKDQPLKIYEAELVERSQNYPAGTFIKADKHGLYLQLIDGVIAIITIQKAGKKKIGYKDFVNGEKDILTTKVI